MHHIITVIFLCVGSLLHAGDTPIYPFKLGEWDFELSGAGKPGGGRIDAVLAALNNKKNVSGEVRLDYRWYVMMNNQFKKGTKAATPFFEALVGFSANEWSSGLNGPGVLKAMREAPPTADLKLSYALLVEGSNQSAAQGSTEQPATRSQSKLEGGDKAQSEAEGRSR